MEETGDRCVIDTATDMSRDGEDATTLSADIPLPFGQFSVY